MAEIVEYRVEKTLDELKLLVNFGLFNEDQAQEIIKKRQDYEYRLRRRQLNQLDYLKYIKFEWNFLKAIEEYRRKIVSRDQKVKKNADKIEDIERKLLVLQAKKLNDVIRSRSAHVSSLFRKVTIKFQFDISIWLAYIAFAKSRHWNTRASALYWRVLRIHSQDEKIWIAAAQHEIEANKAYDTARGLLLRALRHHPKSPLIWAEYFKMELTYMDVVGKRAQIVFRISGDKGEPNSEAAPDDNIWAEDPLDEEKESSTDKHNQSEEDQLQVVKASVEDQAIISGHLPQVIFEKSLTAIADPTSFSEFCLEILQTLSLSSDSVGLTNIKKFILSNLQKRLDDGDQRVTQDLLNACQDPENLKELMSRPESSAKKQRLAQKLSNMEKLYECYESNGIEDTRELFKKLSGSVKNHSLSLYVGMIQVEQWQMKKDTSHEQISRIRSIFETALQKYGRVKAKLWYEYLQFEYEHSKSMEDLERINQIYLRAQSTLVPSKVDRVIERYAIIQTKQSNTDIEYSDYSDLED